MLSVGCGGDIEGRCIELGARRAAGVAHNGGQLTRRLLVDQDAADIHLVAGGVIPPEDIPALEAVGVSRVFDSSTPVSDIADYINCLCKHS